MTGEQTTPEEAPEEGLEESSEGDDEPTQRRLDALQDDIDQTRVELPEVESESSEETEDEPRYIDSGDEGPVDDTIAPPG